MPGGGCGASGGVAQPPPGGAATGRRGALFPCPERVRAGPGFERCWRGCSPCGSIRSWTGSTMAKCGFSWPPSPMTGRPASASWGWWRTWAGPSWSRSRGYCSWGPRFASAHPPATRRWTRFTCGLRQRRKQYQAGGLTEPGLVQATQSLLGHLQHAGTGRLRRGFFQQALLGGMRTETGSNRVIRGGNFNNNAQNTRSANRATTTPTTATTISGRGW